jgi:hypothetical protein
MTGIPYSMRNTQALVDAQYTAEINAWRVGTPYVAAVGAGLLTGGLATAAVGGAEGFGAAVFTGAASGAGGNIALQSTRMAFGDQQSFSGSQLAGATVFGGAIGGTVNLVSSAIGNVVNGGQEAVVHLTNPDAAAAINASQRIGGKWGIFGLEQSSVPESGLARNITTLVPGDLSAQVVVSGDAAEAFQAPLPVGPFSLWRNLAGVRSTGLGSIDLSTGEFVANEVFENGAFRAATTMDKFQYGIHQGLLDYGIDGLLYGVAASGGYLLNGSAGNNTTELGDGRYIQQDPTGKYVKHH